MIVWFTGQPGSGKTTLANAFIKFLKNENSQIKIINLDGDDLRSINKNKDYSKEGRIKNISTAISIMRFLANKNYVCVVSIVAPYKFLRDELKTEFSFLEVYKNETYNKNEITNLFSLYQNLNIEFIEDDKFIYEYDERWFSPIDRTLRRELKSRFGSGNFWFNTTEYRELIDLRIKYAIQVKDTIGSGDTGAA